MMGFAVIFEIGLFLVSISLSYGSSIQQTIPVILAQMLPRGIALAVLALALSIIHQKHGSLRLDRLSGVLKKTPIAAISVMLAFFTLAGVPLLAGFPARLMLWTSLSTQSFTTTLLILIASLGILAAGLRTLGTLITGSSEQDWELNENRPQTWFLILGWVMLFLIGIFPQVFLDPLIRQAAVFAF
jgi:formate hydrogenlyase subunit 3/multisubunit Na+/H+ antiporter MnhD subunit